MARTIAAARRDRALNRDDHDAAGERGGFSEAMARLAAGVAIVSCWDGSDAKGLLIPSITPLSTAPPRILFCIAKASPEHGAVLAADRVGVAILGEAHRRQAEHFGETARPAERFDRDHWALDPQSPPRHRRPLVGLDGVISHRLDAGTDTLFIVQIMEVRIHPGPPLVYYEHGFRRLHGPDVDDLIPGPESLSGVTVWTTPSQAGDLR
jgi:flavin reductase